jgi:carboxymethylenebutenolidase
MAASDLGLAGAIGFYGHPERPGFPTGAPSVMSRITDFSCPVLALQGGDDPGIPVEFDDAFADAMASAGKVGEVVVYEGAPHSFFDRNQAEYAEESADAWRRIQEFIADHA